MRLSLVALLVLLFSCESTPKVIDLASLTEATILTDTVGSGEEIAMGDRVKFHFRLTRLGEKEQVLQQTFGQPNAVIIELGDRRFPAEAQEFMVGMKVGGKRSMFFPEDSLKRRPRVKFDIELLDKIQPPKLWELGEFEYKTTASGLKYHIVEAGTGEKIKLDDKVEIHYTGFFKDGKIFDSSHFKGTPYPVTAGRPGVIQGWIEGVMLLNYGAKVRLEIPYQLAYGEAGRGGIPPKATLYFDMEVMPKK